MGPDLRQTDLPTWLTGRSRAESGRETFAKPGDLAWIRVLWPLAVLFHLAANGGHLLAMDLVGILQAGMALLATAQVIRPSDRGAAILATTYLIILWLKLPVVGNHEIVLGLVSLGVLVSVGLAGRIPDRSWPVVFAPAGRSTLLVAYGFMAFSKLNAGFFDPAVSCAVVFAGDLLGPVDHLGFFWWVFVIATVAVEVSIPVLLAHPRLRTRGVALALGFHFVLALDPVSHVWDFSAALLPLFLLFASPQVHRRLNDVLHHIGRIPTRKRCLFAAVLLAGHGTTIVAAQSVGTPSWMVAYPVWLIVGGTVLGIVLGIGLHGTWQQHGASSGRRLTALSFRFHPALGVLVLLAAVNGMSPYLEVRSAAAFNMYSNLQVAQGQSNHFIVGALRSEGDGPGYVAIADPDDDPVLGYYVDSGLALPVQNLDRYLKENPAIDPMIIEPGNSVPVGSGSSARSLGYGRPNGDDDGLVSSIRDTLARKFTLHRAIDTTGTHRCLRSWGPLG